MSDENRAHSRAHDGRFQKGQSGNLTGWPKKEKQQHIESDFEIIASRTIPENWSGSSVEISVTEALQNKVYEASLSGDRKAIRLVLRWIKKRKNYCVKQRLRPTAPSVKIRSESKNPFNAYEAMKILSIIGAFEEDWFKSDGPLRQVIEPWAAQAALSRRRGGNKPSEQEITAIKCSTRDFETRIWPRGTKK